jgi:hypothetical protein
MASCRFLDGSASLQAGVTGLDTPDPNLHGTYLGVEPFSGKTLDFHWRVGVNVLARNYTLDTFLCACHDSLACAYDEQRFPWRAAWRRHARRCACGHDPHRLAPCIAVRRGAVQLPTPSLLPLAHARAVPTVYFAGVTPVYLPIAWADRYAAVDPSQVGGARPLARPCATGSSRRSSHHPFPRCVVSSLPLPIPHSR